MFRGALSVLGSPSFLTSFRCVVFTFGSPIHPVKASANHYRPTLLFHLDDLFRPSVDHGLVVKLATWVKSSLCFCVADKLKLISTIWAWVSMSRKSNIAFEETVTSPPYCLCFFVKDLVDYVFLGLSGLHSVPLICLSFW